MKVFVVNCGSSSIKYQLFSMTNETVLARGLMERVGTDDASLEHKTNGKTYTSQVVAPTHTDGLKIILEALTNRQTGVIKSVREINGVGHRVVHGGEEARRSAIINNGTIDIIKKNIPLAPLHNPPNLSGIEGAMAAMPDIPHVAVFDTAFFATLPPRAYRYAVPDEWYSKYQVRKYGFHGTSHRYVMAQAAKLLNKPVEEINLITAHLGNGCSMTAIAGGKAVDHSMGMTPLEGLVMGTRSGDIDPAVPVFMIHQGLTAKEVDKVLNKESGLLGVSQRSNDMRDLLAAAMGGNEKAALAIDMFIYRIAKYIGAYHAVLPGLDAIVLTGGIGENSVPVRYGICKAIANLGVKADSARNEKTIRGQAGVITADDSKLPVWVIGTNEELMIARDTMELVRSSSSKK